MKTDKFYNRHFSDFSGSKSIKNNKSWVALLCLLRRNYTHCMSYFWIWEYLQHKILWSICRTNFHTHTQHKTRRIPKTGNCINDFMCIWLCSYWCHKVRHWNHWVLLQPKQEITWWSIVPLIQNVHIQH